MSGKSIAKKFVKLFFLFTAVFLIIQLPVSGKVANDSILTKDQVVFSVTNRLIYYNSDSVISFDYRVDTLSGLKFVKSVYNGQNWKHFIISDFEEIFSAETSYSDWLIFVHGDGQTFERSVETSGKVQTIHQVNVLNFSWPSSNPELNPFSNFKNSRKNVEAGYRQFTELLSLLDDFKKTHTDQNLTLFCHSLGNYYYELLGSDSINDFKDHIIFDNLIINAAAVSGQEHNTWVENLNIQNRIYITSNGGDLNLAGLKVMSKFGVQLGEKPVEPLAVNATYINFTEAIGVRLPPGPAHSYFYDQITEESLNIRNFYSELFHGREVIFTEDLFFVDNEFPGFSIVF